MPPLNDPMGFKGQGRDRSRPYPEIFGASRSICRRGGVYPRPNETDPVFFGVKAKDVLWNDVVGFAAEVGNA